MALDKSFLTRCYSGSNDGPAYWLYRTTDTLDEVQAALYFKNAYHDFQNGDLILVRANDGVMEFEISGARVFPIAVAISAITALSGPNVRTINSLDDFVYDNDFIYLRPNTGYLLLTNIDIGSRTFVDPSGPFSMEGISANFCGLTCSGATALFPVSSSTTLRRMTITLGATQAFFDGDFQGTGDVISEYVSINNGIFGSVRNGTVMIWERSRLNNCGSLKIGGTWGVIRFDTPVITNMPTNGTAFEILADAVISNAISFSSGIWNLDTGTTGIDVAVGASIPDESFQLVNNEFESDGTIVNGLDLTDLEPFYRGNTRLLDSLDFASWSLTDNAVPTTFVAADTFTPVLGLTVEGIDTAHFVHTPSPNNLQFVGARGRVMSVSGSLSISSGLNNVTAGIVVLVNGTPVDITRIGVAMSGSAGSRVSAVSIQGNFVVAIGDSVQLAIKNVTDTSDLVVTDCNFQILQAV